MSASALLLMAALAAEPAVAAESMAAEPAAQTPAPVSVPAPAIAPAKPLSPRELLVGLGGIFKPFALVHTWFTWDKFAPNTALGESHAPFNYATLAECATPACSTFKFRRVEFGFSGAVYNDRVQYKIAIEPARALEFVNKNLKVSGSPKGTTETVDGVKQPQTSTSILNDVTATYVFEYADVTGGQFRIPVSWEGYNGSTKLLLPERALSTRVFGDRRDIGLKVTKAFKYLGYGAFLLNGAGQNNLDTNNQKEMALRLEVYPVAGLMIGVVVDSTVGSADLVGRKFRAEVDLRYENGPFIFQSELIRGQDHLAATAVKGTEVAPSGLVNSWGMYAAAGFTIADVVQPVLRFGHLDPNMGGVKNSGTISTTCGGANVYEVGLNWFIYKNEAKLSVSYSLFDWTDVRAEHQLVVANQLSF